MKILLDECLPVDLRHSLTEYEVHTVHGAGFKGKKNGELLSAAELAGYDVLLTFPASPHGCLIKCGNVRTANALL